jgi:hypothetical protein
MKRFRILEQTAIGHGLKARSVSAEYVGSYPEFTTMEEGHAWIRQVLDPEVTGRYGMTDTGETIDEHSRGTFKGSG